MSVYEILEEIGATSKRTEKEEILRKNKDNVVLRRVLKLTYSKNINFWMKAVEPIRANTVYPKTTLTDGLDFLESRVATRYVTGKKAVAAASGLAAGMSEKSAAIFELVLKRDLRCNINAKSINAAFGEMLIPVFPYMRCSLLNDKTKGNIKWPALAQLKADGMYASILYSSTTETVTICSRSGTKFEVDLLPTPFIEEIKLACMKSNIVDPVLHGELLIMKGDEVLPRQIGNGMLNSVLKGTALPSDVTLVCYVWDIISKDGSDAGVYDVPYENRYNELKRVLSNTDLIQLISTTEVVDADEALKVYQGYIANGLEGAVLKDKKGIWKNHTSKHQLKMKLDVEVEVRAIELLSGNGKNAKTFGSIVCASEDHKMQVNVSGFTDKERESIYNDWESHKNKIMTIRINGLLPANANGICSAFLPRFIEWRMDKTEADTLEKMNLIISSAIGLE